MLADIIICVAFGHFAASCRIIPLSKNKISKKEFCIKIKSRNKKLKICAGSI